MICWAKADFFELTNPNYWPRPLRLGLFLLAIDLSQSSAFHYLLWFLVAVFDAERGADRYAPLGREGEPLREFTRRFDKPDAVRFEDCACDAPSMGDKAKPSAFSFVDGFAVLCDRPGRREAARVVQRSAINKPRVPIDTAAIATKSANHAKSVFRASRRFRNWVCSESQRNAASSRPVSRF